MKYRVSGYRETSVWMTVEADSEREAIRKALRGEYHDDVDTEPGPDIDKKRWSAEPL